MLAQGRFVLIGSLLLCWQSAAATALQEHCAEAGDSMQCSETSVVSESMASTKTAPVSLLQMKQGDLARTDSSTFDDAEELDDSTRRRKRKGKKSKKKQSGKKGKKGKTRKKGKRGKKGKKGKKGKGKKGKGAGLKPGCMWKAYPKTTFTKVLKISGFHIGMAKKRCAAQKCSFTCQSSSKKAWCHIGTGSTKPDQKSVTYKLECDGSTKPGPAPAPEQPPRMPTPTPTPGTPTPTPAPTPGGKKCAYKAYPGKIFETISKASGAHLGMAKKMCAKKKCSFTCMSKSRRAWCHLGRGDLKDHKTAITYKMECS